MSKKQLMSMAEIEKRMSVSAESGRSKLITTGGNTIGTRNERFTFQGQLIGSEFKCTVLGFVQMNAFYESDFDPDNISIPGCFAISPDGEDMAPPDNVPNRQNGTCDGCPQNAFGSSEIGRGKACKNQYRLAVIWEGTTDAREADIGFLTLPPTSIKPFNGYVEAVAAKYDRPIWGVMTTFYFDNDDIDATYKMLLPKDAKKHTNAALLNSILAVEGRAMEELMQGPDVSQYDAPKAAPKSKAKPKGKAKPKAKRKTAPKKKATGGRKGSKFS